MCSLYLLDWVVERAECIASNTTTLTLSSTQLCTISISVNARTAFFNLCAALYLHLHHLHESIHAKGWKLSHGFRESFYSMKRVGGSNNLHRQSVQHIGSVPEYCTSMGKTWCTAWIWGWFSLSAPYEKQKSGQHISVSSFELKWWLHIYFRQPCNHGGLLSMLTINIAFLISVIS